jgi:hypothetical protein
MKFQYYYEKYYSSALHGEIRESVTFRKVRDRYGRAGNIYCDSRSGKNENCNCTLFRPLSMKLNSHRNVVIEEETTT